MTKNGIIIIKLKSNLYIFPSSSSLYSLSVQDNLAKPLPLGKTILNNDIPVV